MIRTLAAFSFALCFSVHASANDTLASVNGGNVMHEKTDAVSMASEELTVSLDKVKVDYVFENATSKPVKGLVTFPIGSFGSETDTRGIADEFLKGKDPLKFELIENGKKRSDVKVATVKKDWPSHEGFDLGVDYQWNQEFPANSKTKLTQSYTSLMGTGGTDKVDDRDKKEYCVDAQFEKAFARLTKRLAKKLKYTPEQVKDQYALSGHMHFESYKRFHYILTTGNNWAGPIKAFKLVIKKDRPSTLVSFCWDGPVKKVSATESVAEAKDFSPKRELDVLFVQER